MPDDRSEPREWEVGASAGACFFFSPTTTHGGHGVTASLAESSPPSEV